ncbi:hypothetical protein AL435_07790, partial [Listeria monocytogenes]|nr:hypothetical protein [Listeria monocytogenes]
VENYSTYFWEQVKNIFEVFTKLKNSKDEEGDLEFINICGGILIEINQVNTKRSDYEAFDKIIIKKFKKNSNNNRIKDILQLQNHLNEVLMKAFNHDLAYVVDILTTWIFSMIVYSLRMYISNHNPQVVRMPHILYQPDILFDRMQSQRGSFIYQNYFDHISLQNSSEEIIYPEETLKIKNKAHILKQLDMLGINKKELFPDVDNIAAYTKKKYGY